MEQLYKIHSQIAKEAISKLIITNTTEQLTGVKYAQNIQYESYYKNFYLFVITLHQILTYYKNLFVITLHQILTYYKNLFVIILHQLLILII